METCLLTIWYGNTPYVYLSNPIYQYGGIHINPLIIVKIMVIYGNNHDNNDKNNSDNDNNNNNNENWNTKPSHLSTINRGMPNNTVNLYTLWYFATFFYGNHSP